MDFKSIQELLNLENNKILPEEDSEWYGIYGLKISIYFELQELEDEEFQEFCNFINKYSNLHELYLPDININVLGDLNRLQTLCDTICRCKMLESLNLYGIDIENSEYLRYFNQILSESKNLKLLNLSWFPFNKLKIENMQDICGAIVSLPKLKNLNLFATDFDKLQTNCFQLLCSAIKKCPQLHLLTLAQRELDGLNDEHFIMLCATIAESKTIKDCNIEGVQPDYNKQRWNTVKGILKKKQNLLTEPGTESTQILFYLSNQKTDTSVNNADASVDKEEQEYKSKRQRTCN